MKKILTFLFCSIMAMMTSGWSEIYYSQADFQAPSEKFYIGAKFKKSSAG